MKYATARICLNGDVISDDDNLFDTPPKFCGKCGSQTITTCPTCNAPIHGKESICTTIHYKKFRPDAYCINCSAPYPWTLKKLDKAKKTIY